MRLAVTDTYAAMQECGFFKIAKFEPGSTITHICNYKQDIGQDLIFWAILYVDGDRIGIPAHVEIRDPNGSLIASQDFNSDRIQLHGRPTSFGNYTASITNTQDKSERLPTKGVGYGIHYGLGHFTSSFQGVINPVGDLIVGMNFWSAFMIVPSIIILVIVGARAAYGLLKKQKNVHN